MPISDRRRFLKNVGQGTLTAGILLNLTDLHAEQVAGTNKIPGKLIICLLKSRHDEKGWEAIHASVEEEHTRYMIDLWQKGIFWAGGPTAQLISVEIYAVDTIEEAKRYQQNSPLYRTGYMHDEQYLEWTPSHWPPLRPNVDPSTGKQIDR